MPPKDVKGSEESWERIETVTEDFQRVAKAMTGSLLLNVVTWSDTAMREQMNEFDEINGWLHHHYGAVLPANLDHEDLLARAVGGEELVRYVLEAKGIEVAMVVGAYPP